MGGDAIFDRLKDHLDVGNDETTADGKVTLEHIECNAACDYAPVMMVNWEFMDNMTPPSAVQLVDDLREGKEVTSTRGPRICTWREAERVLAGFPDGRVDEGPGAGPASLVGLELARENEAGPRPKPDDAKAIERRQRHRRDQGRARPTQADTSPRRDRDQAGRGRGEGRARRVTDTLTPVLTDIWDAEQSWKLSTYEDQGGYGALKTALGMAPDDIIDRGQGLRPPRPRRRRLPDRHEVVVHPAGQPQAEVPRRQRRRVRAGHLQGHPADDGQPPRARGGRDHQLVRDPRQQGLHLHPRRGAARDPPGAGRRRRGLRRGPPRQGHPRLGLRPRRRRPRRRRRLHLWRGDRAARGARGPPRPAAAAPAVPRGRRPLRQPDRHQQRRVDRLGAEHHRARRRVVRLDGHREVQGLRHLQPLRPRHQAGPVRSAARHHAARADRPGRRHPRGPRAEVLDPGRLQHAAADRRAPRRTPRLRGGRRGRLDARHPRAPALRRDHLRGPGGAALDRVLQARVLRQVHAVPRGHLVAGADAGQARAGRSARRATSTCCSTSATTSSAARSARSPTVR